MELSCPLGITRCPSAWHRKFNPNNNAIFSSIFSLFGGKRSLKSSVNFLNICLKESLFGQDGWILASFFFCVFMDLDFVSVHKNAKKELGQYPAILTSRLVNNAYVFCLTIFSLPLCDVSEFPSDNPCFQRIAHNAMTEQDDGSSADWTSARKQPQNCSNAQEIPEDRK